MLKNHFDRENLLRKLILKKLAENTNATIVEFGREEERKEDYYVFLETVPDQLNRLHCLEYTVFIFGQFSTSLNHGGSLRAKFNYAIPKEEHAKEYYTNEMKICDIVMKTNYENKGYGSILMSHYLQYCTKNKVKRIWGIFSKVDEKGDNEARRNHFYKKHGFEIAGREIEKILY